MNAREELAKQLGFLILANIEQAAQIAALQKQLEAAKPQAPADGSLPTMGKNE